MSAVFLVNDQPVTEAVIMEEQERISRDPRWAQLTDGEERAKRLRAAAEYTAIERILVEQVAMADPRPIDATEIEREVVNLKVGAGCRPAYNDDEMRKWVDRDFRIQRTIREMVSSARKPSESDVRGFHEANRANFRTPEFFEAAHIVRHVNHEQTEEQARAAIEAALAELEQGVPFGGVADRHSDRKGNGGDLGRFKPGDMVEEFEQALRSIEPGQKTGVFRTPFGFHIAELRARDYGSPAPFEDVRADIERVLTMASEHQAYQQAVHALRLKAEIRRAPTVSAQNSAA